MNYVKQQMGACDTYTEQHNIPVFFAVVQALDTLPVVPPATPKVVGRQIFCINPFDADKVFATAEDFVAALQDVSVEVMFDNYYENRPQITQALSQVVYTKTVGDETQELHFTMTATSSEDITSIIDDQIWYTGIRLLLRLDIDKEMEIAFPYAPVLTSGTDTRMFNLLSGMLNVSCSGLGVPPLVYDRYTLTITDTTGTPENPINTRPPAVTDLRFTVGEYGSQVFLRADWDPVPATSFYKVDIALDTNQTATPTPDGETPAWASLAWDGAPSEVKTTDPFAVFLPVELHRYYYVRVCPVNAVKGATELPGAWYAERVQIELTAQGTKPAAPTNLTAEAIPYLRINLKWDESVTDTVTTYRVYRSTSYGGTYTLIGDVPAPISWFVDFPPPTNGVSHTPITYYYYVTAVSAVGVESDPSNIVSATPIMVDDFGVEAESLEMAIKNVHGDKITNGTITGPKIKAASVDLNAVACGTLMGAKVVAGTVEAYTGVFANRLKASPIAFTTGAGITVNFLNYGTGTGQISCPEDHANTSCWITVRRISQSTTGGCNCNYGCWEDLICEVPQSWIDESTSGTPTGSGTFTMSVDTERYAYLRLHPAGTLAEPDGVDGVLRFRSEYPTGLYDIPLAWFHRDADGVYHQEGVYINGTVIDGAHIATGTIQAEHLAAKTITADKIQARELLAYEAIFPSRLTSDSKNIAVTPTYSENHPTIPEGQKDPNPDLDVTSLHCALSSGEKVTVWALGNAGLGEELQEPNPALNIIGTMEKVEYDITPRDIYIVGMEGHPSEIDVDGNWFVYFLAPKDPVTHEPTAAEDPLELHVTRTLPAVTRDGTTLPIVLATIVRGAKTLYTYNPGTGTWDGTAGVTIQVMTNFVNGTYISGDFLKTPIITADSGFISGLSADKIRTGILTGLSNPYTYFDLDKSLLHLAREAEPVSGSLFDWNGGTGLLTIQARSMAVQDAKTVESITDYAGIVLKSNQTLDTLEATDWIPEHHYQYHDKVRYGGAYYECTNSTGAFSTEQYADPPSWWPPDTTTQCWTLITDVETDGTLTGLGFFDYAGGTTPKTINERTLALEEPGLQGMLYAKQDELHMRAMHGLFLGGGDNTETKNTVQIWGRQLAIRTGLNPVIQTTNTSSPGFIFNDRGGTRLGGLYVKAYDKGLFYKAVGDATEQRLSVATCLDISASVTPSLWSGSQVNVSWDDANRYYLVLTQNTVINLVEPPSGQSCTFMFHIRQDGTGGHTVSWLVGGKDPATGYAFNKLLWPDGTAPEITTDAFDMNVISLSYTPGNYYVGTYSLGLR